MAVRQKQNKKHRQNNFFERIIRSQNELINIENYIKENIVNWDKDTNNINK